MLVEDAENEYTAAPVLSTLRELLAKNIAALNQDVEAGLFFTVVNQILFALTAARLLEASGCVRGAGLDDLLRAQGLLKGLSSFFEKQGNRGSNNRPGPPTTTGNNESLFRFPDLDTDEKIVETVINLTGGFALTNELKYFREKSGEGMLSSFLARKVRLSPDNRMVIEETIGAGSPSCLNLPPGRYIPGIARRVLDRWLSGKSPVSGGSPRILDPCCETGLSLCEALAFLFEWHLSWYEKHLVPVLRDGKDPVSRNIQKIIPKPVGGLATLGFSPLPVYWNETSEYTLSWYEKVRILSESIFGMDNDPQAVMITRLLLLSQVLDHMTYPDLESFRPEMIFGILFTNVRSGNALVTETCRGTESSHETTCWPGYGDNTAEGYERSGTVREDGFDLVICQISGLTTGNRNYHRDSPSVTCRAGNRSADPEPLFIEFGLSVLRKGGIYCGTGTGRWQRASNASRFRAWLATFQVNEIIMFRVLPGVKQRTVAPVVTCITNAPALRPFTVMIAGDVPGHDFSEENTLFLREVDPGTLSRKPWMVFEINSSRLRDLIRSRGSPLSQALLGEYFRSDDIEPGRLVISRESATRVLKKDPIVCSFLLPFVCPEEITPYSPVNTVPYLVVMQDGVTGKLAGKSDDPVSWFSHHHTTFFNLIDENSGSSSGKTGCWWEWKGPDPPRFLHGPVLLFSPGTGTSRPGWTIAPYGAYPGPGVVALPGRDLSLLGILNSTVFWLYLLTSGGGLGMNRFGEIGLPGFPLFIPDPECRQEMELYSAIAGLVRRRVALPAEYGNAVSSSEQGRIPYEAGAYERAIDRCVCMLYGMSADDANAAGYLVSEYLQKLQEDRRYRSDYRETRV